MEKTFETDGPVEADVVVPAGSINVTRTEDHKVTVVLELQGAPRGARAGRLLAETEVSFAAGKLRVRVPERAFRNVALRCHLRLPEGSSLVTKTASADVQSSVELGAFDWMSASGDTGLQQVTGDVRHRSASGEFRCGAVGGALRLRTASGDVAIGGAAGDVELSLASGDARIDDAAASVDVRSASGDVRLDCVHRGRIRAQTASGDVTIGVAEGVGAYLDVTTVSGDTRCTLPFHEGAGSAGASLEIVARTVSGDVVVHGARS